MTAVNRPDLGMEVTNLMLKTLPVCDRHKKQQVELE
jgi:hypothetical protein